MADDYPVTPDHTRVSGQAAEGVGVVAGRAPDLLLSARSGELEVAAQFLMSADIGAIWVGPGRGLPPPRRHGALPLFRLLVDLPALKQGRVDGQLADKAG